MTDEQLAITEGLAKWMGWEWQPAYLGAQHVKKPEHQSWDSWYPFNKLDDARLLLVECDKRGLMIYVGEELSKQVPLPDWYETLFDCDAEGGIIMGLMATAEQITLAVWKVAKEQGKQL